MPIYLIRDGLALQYASEEMRNDEDVVTAAVEMKMTRASLGKKGITNSKPSDTVPINTFLNSKHGGNPQKWGAMTSRSS